MTKHDEVRKILHENGFKFDDGRTALDMTDEEVNAFIAKFVQSMSEIGRQMTIVMQNLSVAFTNAITPLQDLTRLLEERPERQ